MDQVMETEDFLEHYGVKGMRWGHRKERVPGQKTLRERRQLNKVARAEDRQAARAAEAKAQKKQDHQILNARRQLPKAQQEYDAARAQYKVDKKVLGRVAAKRPLKVKANNLIDIATKADELTSGEQKIFDNLQAGHAFAYAASGRDMSPGSAAYAAEFNKAFARQAGARS